MNEAILTPPAETHGQVPGRDRQLPAWFDEFSSALVYASHLLCVGNVRDLFPDPDGDAGSFQSFEETVRRLLARRGVRALLLHDPVLGLRLHPRCDRRLGAALAQAGLEPGRPAASLSELAEIQRKLAAFGDFPVALLLDYASQLADPADRALTDFFVGVDRATRLAPPRRPPSEAGAPPRNPTIWIADKAGDLPDWFAIGNAHLREISVELPDLEDRFAFAERIGAGLGRGIVPAERDAAELLQRFALECDGETLQTMRQIARVAQAEGHGLGGLSDAVRTYRTGLRRNPWTSPILRARIGSAPERLGARILGQPHAIDKTLDILARSIMGLSGAQDGRRFRRPRGVLFFAGPTGVGKTELAKAVTELLFGDDAACHRFDMSEFMEEASVTRLIGAPPGQPGHDRGGELVNAVHRRPFSVFLFDEIEKAHPRILDIFLQILDEGRLTDARGATGHFSETLIIFTSNIGMLGSARETNMGIEALPSDAYRQLDDKITRAVHEHFRYDLRRPELINRIGQNIVVFDFLRYDSIARIFDAVLERVIATVAAEHGLNVTLSAAARETLKELCTHDVFDGGRGVGNRIETHLVNPLARAIFDGGFESGLRIEAISNGGARTRLHMAGDARPG